jgi:hypothetical protein
MENNKFDLSALDNVIKKLNFKDKDIELENVLPSQDNPRMPIRTGNMPNVVIDTEKKPIPKNPVQYIPNEKQ